MLGGNALKTCKIQHQYGQKGCRAGNRLVLILNSPGGDPLAAERIVHICRSYSKDGEYIVVVPKMAKSAATMISLGASEIWMSRTSELGPQDESIRNVRARRIQVDERDLATAYDLMDDLVDRVANRVQLTTDGFRVYLEAVENHSASVALHHIHYNFARVHKTLPVPTAMHADLSDHVWSLEETVALLDQQAKKAA